MRPKRIILCVGTNPQALSVLTYMLHINGFLPLACESPAKAYAHAQAGDPFDLLLLTESIPFDEADNLVNTIRPLTTGRPTLKLHKPPADGEVWPIYSADAMLSSQISSLELLERIRTMTARKRGPRKLVPLNEVECLA